MALALSLGCTSEEPTNAKSTVLFCEADCNGAARCGFDVPERCVADCADSRPGLNSFAPEAVAIVTACIDALSCSALTQEEAYTPCWEKAQETAPVREETRAFCAEFARGIFECGSSYTIEQCERDFVMMTGTFLETMKSCVTSCETWEQCVDATWESL